jgi:ubiquinone/menaquinone biosynthesis C-methylase UbiE
MVEVKSFAHMLSFQGPEFQKSLKSLEKEINEKDLIIVDYGCGPGRYCEILEKHSKQLYCVDIDPESLNIVRNKFKKAVILNDLSKIDGKSVDVVFMANSFHDFEDKKTAVTEIKRILKDDGRVFVIDWEKKNTNFGPPQELRLSKKDYLKYFNWMKLEKEFNGGKDHYGIILKK